MRTTIQLRVPDDAECVLTITASVKDLKRLKAQLGDPQTRHNWPISKLEDQLTEAIRKAEAEFCTRNENEPPPAS